MNTILPLKESDIAELKIIHQKFYADEFTFPDFLQSFICSFIIRNENDEIVMAAGIKPIAELIAITNKELFISDKRAALYETLNASSFITSKNGFDSIHAFIQDEKWYRTLIRHKFIPCKGKALYYPVL